MGLGADKAVLRAELQHADEAQRPVQAQHLHCLAQAWRCGQIHDLSAAAHAGAMSHTFLETRIFPSGGLMTGNSTMS